MPDTKGPLNTKETSPWNPTCCDLAETKQWTQFQEVKSRSPVELKTCSLCALKSRWLDHRLMGHVSQKHGRADSHARKHCSAATTGLRRLRHFVVPSDRGVGTAEITAVWTLRRETLWLVTGHWEHSSGGTSTDHRKLHSRFRQRTRWMTAQPLTAACETSQ